MLKDCDFKNSYSSGMHEPKEFFTEALIESKHFDLGLGFFSSSAFRSLAYGFALFIANGGTMRIVINHILSEKDKEAIQKGENGFINNFEDSILKDFDRLVETFSKEDEQFFKCFSYLVQQKRLQFVATMSSHGGLGHDKYGVLSDEKGDKVSFIGSANFSSTALESNAETITVFRSWKEDDRVKEYEQQFQDTWKEDNSHLIHIPLDRVVTHIEGKFNVKDLKKLIDSGAELRDIENNVVEKGHQTKALPTYLLEKIEFKEQEPRFPFPSERDIQIDAYNAWINNDKSGIFAMATGTGKTVTALNCVLKQYKENGFYKAIIAVPTQALALQWEKEAKAFNFQNVVSTHTEKDWKDVLSRYTTRSLRDQKRNIIIITTYATFVRKTFQTFMNTTRGLDTFIYIADEAHNLGSESVLKKLPEQIKWRIGLSATPERVYDSIGSKKLYDFFSSEPPLYTYRYTMKQAIDNDILCHYEYYPIFISLTDIEMAEYARITAQLRNFIDPQTKTYKKEAEMLLTKRKRVIHKAENKKVALVGLLENLKEQRKLDYTFVFVPEGYEPNYEDKDSYDIDDEDKHLINEYADIFKEKGYHYHKYISGLEDSEGILKSFAKGDIQVLLAMKCLDEGVDIPRAEHAIFCSSTGNPRQFVQRRGRVLRKSPDKTKARIWDLVALPPQDGGNNDSSTIEKNLFTSEVKRIVNFAVLADNQYDIIYGELKETCESLGIDLFGMIDEENKQYL